LRHWIKYQRPLIYIAAGVCMAAVVFLFALLLASGHQSGILGVVRCAPAVNACGRTNSKAVVYVLPNDAPFSPFNPPSSSYQTDDKGHFQISLDPEHTGWPQRRKAVILLPTSPSVWS
jgi:hypothetical protein